MSAILDVMIGMVYVYVFFSTLCSGVAEWIARMWKRRAKALKQATNSLLGSAGDGQLAKEFYTHTLISGLAESGSDPTYIPSSHFALALVDLAVDFPEPPALGAPAPTATLKPKINSKGQPAFTPAEAQLIRSIIQGLNSRGAVQTSLEKWFNDSMERVSGGYKRKTYRTLLFISLFVSFAFGVDTFRLANELYRNGALQQAMVTRAQASVQKSSDPAKADVSLSGLNVPIGWQNAEPFAVFGCIVTAFALTLGSPFWFDLLGRLVNLRQTGVPPDMKGRIVAD